MRLQRLRLSSTNLKTKFSKFSNRLSSLRNRSRGHKGKSNRSNRKSNNQKYRSKKFRLKLPVYAIKSWNWKSKKKISKHKNLIFKSKSEPQRPLSTSSKTTKKRRNDWLKKPKFKSASARCESVSLKHKIAKTFRY